jgi:hypothetical protein
LSSAIGTVPLTIFISPPPTSFLYLTSAMSGSTPVVSQSIMKPMVPVGASTGRLRVAVAEVLAELNGLVPRLLGAAVEIAGTYFWIDLAHRIAMLRITRRNGSRFFS